MKPIKFNLVLSGRIVRSIEELKGDFNLDDVYDLYQKRILQKWLEIHEEHGVLEKLDAMDVTDTRSELRGILSAFGYHENVMDVELSSHIYKKIHEEEVGAFISNNRMYDEMIEGYHVSYEFLKKRLHELIVIPIMPARLSESDDTSADVEIKSVNDTQIPKGGLLAQILMSHEKNYQEILQKRESKPDAVLVKKEVQDPEELTEMLKQASKTYGEIKAIVHELVKRHHELLRLDVENFFKEYLAENPIVIMVCLMNVKARELMMKHPKIRPMLVKASQDSAVLKALSPYTKTYEGDTDGMWKYLGDVKKSYLVLKVSEGAVKVGEQLDLKAELTHTDLNGEYLLLDGLTFKSSSKDQSILYMEV